MLFQEQTINNIYMLLQVELYPRRMMLCICGIPLHYTDKSFRDFLSLYGEVETAFLSLTSCGKVIQSIHCIL